VALIRTDVTEDRIAYIFRVNEYEQVQSETVSSCIGGDSRNTTPSAKRHLPEDDNHHSHRRGNLKSYTQAIVPGLSVHICLAPQVIPVTT
jgi:hypothetical protein